MHELEGKVAVITGAGSGMGRASAEVFVREGAKVVAGDISGAEKDTAAEVGGGVLPVHCDVTKEADVEAMVRAAMEEFVVPFIHALFLELCYWRSALPLDVRSVFQDCRSCRSWRCRCRGSRRCRCSS